jgi:hypothetical protein
MIVPPMRFMLIMLVMMILSLACKLLSVPSDSSPDVTDTIRPLATDIETPFAQPTIIASPTFTPEPVPTPDPLPPMAVVGPVEVVFDWTTDRCAPEDIPDSPARAYRDDQGRVQLIASHYVSRRWVGADLNTAVHECAIVATSDRNPDSAQFNDVEWILSPYTEDGRTIYALVSNEYQGHTHPGQCPSGEYLPCWQNSITLAVSTDAGASFADAAPPPQHMVAAMPYPYQPGAGPFGVFESSNILKDAEGYYYAFVRVDEFRSEQQRVCLIRTVNLANPRSWRAWDGAGFSVIFTDPYVEPLDLAIVPQCAAISPDALGVINSSVTFNTFLNRFVMVGTTAKYIRGREVWGVYYSFSDDLIHWDERILLLETELPWTYEAGDPNPILYPSILDPQSPSRNFETTGKRAYLYFTQINVERGEMTFDRDLVRVLVEFFLSDAQANKPLATATP